MSGGADTDPRALIAKRVDGIGRSMARAGLVLDDIVVTARNAGPGSPETTELAILVRESLYQVREVTYELRRRWPTLINDPQQLPLASWVKETEKASSEALARRATG
jgi:hypothetical protein